MSQIYYSRWKGRIAGPYTATQIQEELRAKRLSRFHEISTDQRDWRSLADLPELMPKPPPAPVVAAPVITPADVRPASRRPVTPREELNDEEGDEERMLPRVRRASANNHEAADRDNTWALPGQGAFCTSCGKPIMLGAVICPRCGVPTDRRATAGLATNLNSDTPNDIDDVARQEASQPFKRYSMIGATLVILVVVGILAMVWEMDFLRWCKNNEWKGPVFLTILGLSAIGTYADQTRKAPDGGFTVGTHIILGVGLVLAFLIGTVAGYVLNPIYKVSEGTFKGMGNVTISDAIDKLDDVSWGVSRSKDRPLVSVSASYSENGKANKIVASFVVSRGNDTFELTQASCNGQDLGADNFVAFLFKTANRK